VPALPAQAFFLEEASHLTFIRINRFSAGSVNPLKKKFLYLIALVVLGLPVNALADTFTSRLRPLLPMKETAVRTSLVSIIMRLIPGASTE